METPALTQNLLASTRATCTHAAGSMEAMAGIPVHHLSDCFSWATHVLLKFLCNEAIDVMILLSLPGLFIGTYPRVVQGL